MDEVRDRIRTIPDYPAPGVQFRDITTLLGDAQGFGAAIDRMVQICADIRIDKVAGIEARGFVFGGAVARQLSLGFVPVRKKGKLPGPTLSQDYELEYGFDTVEIHKDAITEGQSIFLVDDLLATGGSAAAAVELIRKAGGVVVGCGFVVDLPELGGRKRLQDMGLHVTALCEFEGD